MSAGKFKFTIEKGLTFHPTMKYIDIASGNPVDLTGYTARMFIGTDPANPSIEDYIDLTTENGGITIDAVNGLVKLFINATNTTVITWSWAAYVLDLSPDGVIWDGFLEGEIIVKERPV